MNRAAERPPPGQATAPKLRVFIESGLGVLAHEGIIRANIAGVRIASNKEVDAILNGGDIDSIRSAIPCNTGTASAYVEPGKAFRQATQRIASLDNENYVVYTDSYTKERWLYHVREDFLDQKDAILLCEHPDFLFDIDGKDRFIRPYMVGIVTDFPSKAGWYQTDPEYRTERKVHGVIPLLVSSRELMSGLVLLPAASTTTTTTSALGGTSTSSAGRPTVMGWQ